MVLVLAELEELSSLDSGCLISPESDFEPGNFSSGTNLAAPAGQRSFLHCRS